MPSVDRISKLFKALAVGDIPAAENVAAQIVADEENKGHYTAAQRLKSALISNGKVAPRRHGDVGTPNGAPTLLDGVLSHRPPATKLRDVVLSKDAREKLSEIVKEFNNAAYLRACGIHRRSKIIFHGPPGCGKSLTAHALASELKLPLYIVRFDSVIGAYLGQTATHLRQLFQFAESKECALLFDEIDALGKRRGSPTEVGELDRIVIALMQELELSDVSGLVIATSNLPENLDSALWRRFDLQLQFPAPSKLQKLAFARARAKAYSLRSTASLMRRIEKVLSYADVEKLIEDEARRLALRAI